MKNKLLRVVAVFGVFSVLVFALGCKPKDEQFMAGGPRGIIIHMSGDHSAIDKHWGEIVDKLKPHGEIYHIRTYKDGQLSTDQPPIGTLYDIFMQHTIDEYDAYASNRGFTGHAIQIGLGIRDPRGDSSEVGTPEEISPSPSPEMGGPTPTPSGPSMPHPHLTKNIAESKTLVEELRDLVFQTPTPTPTP